MAPQKVLYIFQPINHNSASFCYINHRIRTPTKLVDIVPFTYIDYHEGKKLTNVSIVRQSYEV